MFLTLLNLRGVKESVVLWVPVFFVFVRTTRSPSSGRSPRILATCPTSPTAWLADVHSGAAELGWLGLIAVVLRAYSLGAGTYTGIEAVSNGLNTLREPRVQTGKRTMVYMAVVAVVRRRRPAAGVSAVSRRAGGRQNAERRAV